MVPDDGRDEVVLAPGESIALHDYKFDEPYSTDFTFSGPTRATAVIEWDYHRSRVEWHRLATVRAVSWSAVLRHLRKS
jgi:hypothetical protein